jgi:hypothetical protein
LCRQQVRGVFDQVVQMQKGAGTLVHGTGVKWLRGSSWARVDVGRRGIAATGLEPVTLAL